jgi:sugar phosphate isomerase/epimerase
MVGGKDAVSYFKEYPGRFEMWHIKDKKEVGASGEMDFEAAFKAKKKAGMKHIIVEVEDYSYTPLESVQKSLEFLQNAKYVK